MYIFISCQNELRQGKDRVSTPMGKYLKAIYFLVVPFFYWQEAGYYSSI